MILKINGKEKEVSDNINISQLMDELKIPKDRVAIELNKEIAKRSNWENIYLKEGDALEIVTFVGGG
ncbi:MAG: sulfur carrier protein ThiS [bacterium]